MIFHRFSLEMSVLVHPQPGLLWPASLPGAFFFLLMSLLRKTISLYDSSMDVLENDGFGASQIRTSVASIPAGGFFFNVTFVKKHDCSLFFNDFSSK